MLSVTACATPKALEPVDWVDQQVQRFPVSGKGAWARLTNKPLVIGQYSAQPSSAFTGGGISTTTTDSTQIGVAVDHERGKEIGVGTSTTSNEGSIDFHLSAASGPLAQVRCRQYLKSTSGQISGTNRKGDESWSIMQNTGYKASLSCSAKALNAAWPQWGMDLETYEAAPFRGRLSVDGAAYDVAGSKATSIGSMGLTSSYEIRQGNAVLALVDLNGDGQLSISMPASNKNAIAFVSAAAVLMLANDPVTEE
ncbi:MAG: hypothetical protein ACPHER_07110 [Nevskiales bacterium]